MSQADPQPEDETSSPEEIALFEAWLQHVEDELAKTSEDDHRRALARILRNADNIELAEKLEREITDGR